MGYKELSPAPPEAMTDGSEAYPLTNLEQHVQHGYRVTRELLKGGGGKYACDKNEGGRGKGRGGQPGGQLTLTTASEDPEEPSDASSKLGLFMGRGAFGRGRSFGGEDVLLARSTGQHGSRPRRAEFRVDGSPSHNNSRS